MCFRCDAEALENGGAVSERTQSVDRSVEDLAKGAGSSTTYGMTRAARALTVRVSAQ